MVTQAEALALRRARDEAEADWEEIRALYERCRRALEVYVLEDECEYLGMGLPIDEVCDVAGECRRCDGMRDGGFRITRVWEVTDG